MASGGSQKKNAVGFGIKTGGNTHNSPKPTEQNLSDLSSINKPKFYKNQIKKIREKFSRHVVNKRVLFFTTKQLNLF